MIPKVVPNRRDGKSSFRQLAAYVTNGITQSGEPPEKYSWSTLTQYITKESVLDALGEQVEKTIGVEISNVSSLANAPAEMYAVAQQAPRVKEPVYHYILSWPEHERPATQDIFAAARHTLAALGMQDHQHIIAIHANTDNLHAHIEVNRIHPKTFRAFDPYYDYLTLHRAAREVEIQYGWHHDNGAFNVEVIDGQKHIVRNLDYRDPDLAPSRAGAQRAEVWSGEQSLETWCKGEPANDLKRVLKDGATTSWQDVHRALALHGLELRDAGGGGLRVADVSEAALAKQGKPLAVSASAAFRFLRRGELEARFGPFKASKAEVNIEPRRTYRRDPDKRLESRMERRALRDALHARFKADEKAAREWQAEARRQLAPFVAEDRERHLALLERQKQMRSAIRRDPLLSPGQKQQAYMVAKISMARLRAQLVEQIRRERDERRALLPPIPTWREWVEQQAQLGDEAALSALRGMVYQDGRNQKKKLAREEIDAQVNAIGSEQPQRSDPQVRRLENLVCRIAKNGRVTYRFPSGEEAFRDEGERVTYRRADVSDQALSLSLRYSAEKWPDGIRVYGGDFAFKARVVRMAVEHGIVVRNFELRELERQFQAEKEAIRSAKGRAQPVQPTTLTPSLDAKAIDSEIKQAILQDNPKATISHASTHNKRYTGRILWEDAHFVAQSVREHEYVLHERSLLDGQPMQDQRVIIHYRSGRALVRAAKSRDTGRDDR
ncbi:TraI/MobA(P) family conjugative relaxase [Caballeronia sp. BCC1704]|uniref:TraI/MobA(P) family conjugative relaxase n=1 Tax=Caballeronia sp. BCC1704 TaxID=2676300 RepID=UPI00158EA3FB|nr:TraI/MobA(P) family conjugative relaxase [Caballeronia sp. BCC1704]